MKHLFLFIAAVLFLPLLTVAQKKGGNSILKSEEEITWLGLDFSQVRYIGSANQYKDAGQVTDEQMRDKYFAAWNDLFINEQKKYDVARYVHRASVGYDGSATQKANEAVRGSVFSDNPGDYQLLTEDRIATLVKGYNLQGIKGIGLVFFVEGMSKSREEASAWVTFVDARNRTVVATRRMMGRAGGFGFRNYWAKSFYNILKDIPDQF